MVSSKYILLVSFCVVVLGVGCGNKSPTPRIPSDLSLWKQVEIPEPPEIATIPLENAPPENFHLRWSPDDRRLAYFGEGDTVINIYDFKSDETQRIVPGGHISGFTTRWHPGGKRLLVGTRQNAPMHYGGVVAEWAESLAEYDVESGTLRRRLSAEDLGGFPHMANYSPDGNRLLVTTRRLSSADPSVDIDTIRRPRATQRTSIVEEDGSVRTILSGQESPSCPMWSADGSGLIYTRSGSAKRYLLGRELSPRVWEELIYRPLDEQQSVKVIDTLRSGLIGVRKYPDTVESMPYGKRGHREVKDVNGEVDYFVNRYELWEYEFSTETRSMVVDLYALFAQLYDDPSWSVVFGDCPTSSDWYFGVLISEVSGPWDYWYVSLGSDRIVGQLPSDFGSWQTCAYSHSGPLVAYVDHEPVIHVLDLGAVLPRGSGE